MTAPKVREVHGGIFLVHLPLPMRPTIVNVYLIDGGDEWALVDTGMKSTDSLAAFREALDEIGCRPEQVRKILCTHHHPDHFGAAGPLKEMTGAAVYVHPYEYERSHIFVGPRADPEMVRRYFLAIGMPLQHVERVPSPHEFWSSMYAPAEPDVHLADGQVIRVGAVEIEVVWTPGHAPGHCVMYLRRQRVLISGDHLLPKITPHVGYFHGGPENPLGDFLDSQQKIQRLEVDWVLPAHGGVFSDHRHRANQIIHHHDVRLREMADLLRRRPRVPYDVARQAFGFDLESSLMIQFPATFETLAHLEYLCHAGQAVRAESDGQILYRAA